MLGVNIGGMTEEEAAQAVSNALPDMQISLYLYPNGGDLPDTLCRLRMRRFPFPTWTHRLMSPPWSRVICWSGRKRPSPTPEMRGEPACSSLPPMVVEAARFT